MLAIEAGHEKPLVPRVLSCLAMMTKILITISQACESYASVDFSTGI